MFQNVEESPSEQTKEPSGNLTDAWFPLAQNDNQVPKPSRISSWPTREGFHFAFLIVFILVGAIIRDVNLLVILAGILVSMLLLQGRLASRTIHGLSLTRRLPRTVQARSPFRVDLELWNHRKWLGAWLIVVQDQLYRVDASGRKSSDGFTARELVGQVEPMSGSTISYECRLPHRGVYRFGPLTASTRFPLGLIQSSLTTSSMDYCLSVPAVGELLPSWRELFRTRRSAGSTTRSQSAAGEGEFYGLRDYRVGDSPRLIHWRTSARRNELSVRQFEKQDCVESCLLLDLFRHENELGNLEIDDAEETAIEMVATIVTTLIERARGTISVALAGSSQQSYLQIRSRGQIEKLLRSLAMLDSTSKNDWYESVQTLSRPLRSNPFLLVVSTRGEQWQQARSLAKPPLSDLLHGTNFRWIDVRNNDHVPFFRRAQV